MENKLTDGWMERRMYGKKMDGWMDRWMTRRMDGKKINGWKERIHGWKINERINGWMA